MDRTRDTQQGRNYYYIVDLFLKSSGLTRDRKLVRRRPLHHARQREKHSASQKWRTGSASKTIKIPEFDERSRVICEQDAGKLIHEFNNREEGSKSICEQEWMLKKEIKTLTEQVKKQKDLTSLIEERLHFHPDFTFEQLRLLKYQVETMLRSCIQDAKVCKSLSDDSVNEIAEDFYRKNLSPIQSGCCKPPTSCDFVYVSATNWTSIAINSTDTDCSKVEQCAG
ncbi:hypothetical protein KI387_028559 [Taxus chinensis]|uniref:Uncharacterized protein n=1 Tax=Taxus chinensis TaxID=29808 RepID=A0AA38FCR9_TAXCH|nr:hypothetical protein KI387_028559 [Taxus chinensis]